MATITLHTTCLTSSISEDGERIESMQFVPATFPQFYPASPIQNASFPARVGDESETDSESGDVEIDNADGVEEQVEDEDIEVVLARIEERHSELPQMSLLSLKDFQQAIPSFMEEVDKDFLILRHQVSDEAADAQEDRMSLALSNTLLNICAREVPRFSQLPGPKFRIAMKGFNNYVQKCLQFLKDHSTAEQFRAQKRKILAAISNLQATREAIGAQNAMPIYSMREEALLPDYSMAPLAEYADAPKFSGIPVVAGTNPPLDLELTEEFINSAVRSFAEQPLFPWESGDDGCYARAAFMRDQFILSGVPEERIGKVHLVVPKDEKWVYHVALAIELDNGDYRIVDPYFNPEHSMPIETWTQHQRLDDDPRPLESVSVEIGATTLPYKSNQYTLYFTPHTTIMRVDKERNLLVFEQENDEIRLGTIERLSEIRTQLDIRAIEKTYELVTKLVYEDTPPPLPPMPQLVE